MHLSAADILSYAARLAKVLIGLVVLAFGISLYLRTGLGTDAFTVFYAGLARRVGLSTGRVLQLSLAVLAITVFILDRRRMGLGTVLHAALVGVFIDLFMRLGIPRPEHPALACAMLAAAVFLTGCGLAFYIHAGLGAGAIDAAMLVLHARLGIDIRWAKIVLDLSFAAAGFLLGGPMGIGTLVGALLTGPLIQRMLHVYDALLTRRPVSAVKP